MATLGDVAREAEVSVSIASRVLNDDPALRARDETRERVRAVALRLGYAPNHAARALRLARASTIALVLPDIGNALVAETLRGAEDAANEFSLHVLLARAERLRHEPQGLRRLAADGRVDGFLVQLDDDADVTTFEQDHAPDAPVVLLHAYGRHTASVVLDDVAAVQMATRHLIGLGHVDIGYLGGLAGNQSAQRRAQGFRATLAGAGLPRRRRWTTTRGFHAADGRAAVDDILGTGSSAGRKPALPSALVVANVNAGFGALQRLREVGVAVPGDLSLVALHDSPFADYTGLTTVRMPLHEMGRQAVALLAARVDGERPAHLMVTAPPPLLITRGSTAVAADG